MTAQPGRNEPQRFGWSRTRVAVLLVLMAGGLLIRLHGIGQPLVRFHPTRHYRSAVLARACYYDASRDVPAWARGVADANRAMQPVGEPPFTEWLACASYRLLGREDIRIPRALSALWWVLGAVPIYALALRAATPSAAIVATTLYLYLPYAIEATRSFQPDALMTLCSLAAILGVVRDGERPSASRMILAAAAVGTATLVKPMSVFLTVAAIAGQALARSPVRGAVTKRLLVFVAIAYAPATIYYGYGAIFGTLARDQMRMRFVPSLLVTSFFWTGWLTQIRRVFGLFVFAIAVAGSALARTRASRALLCALWVGYAAFAVAFTYHMPTHNYYHLPYIAVAALGVAAALERIERPLARRTPPAAMAGLGIAIAPAIAVWGTLQAWPRLTIAGAEAVVARYERIGELTGHSRQVLFLDSEYGYSLMYHGQLSGDSWPNADDLAAETLEGRAPLPAPDRFARDYASFRPDYFVVTDLDSLDAEPDLQRFLTARLSLVEKTPKYQVYRFQ